MAQVNFRVDDDVKLKAEKVCEAMGMNMTTALNIFLVKLGNERKIPFEITADPDPFYSEKNMSVLRKRAADMKAKKNISRHDLIEE